MLSQAAEDLQLATGPRPCIITTTARIGKLLHDQHGILYA